MKLQLSVYLVTYFQLVNSYNILVIIDFPARSTFVFLKPLLKELSSKGHALTVVSNFAINEKLPNYKEILIEGTSILDAEKLTSDLKYIAKIQFLSKYIIPSILSKYSNNSCELLFSTKAVEELYTNNETYDVIMVNIFHSECVFQIANKLNGPLVAFHPTIMVPWAAGKFAMPLNPAVVPSPFLPLSTKMSFSERLENAVVTWCHLLYHNLVMYHRDKTIVAKYFGPSDAEKLEKIGNTVSLFMLNTHYSVNLPKAALPNIIEIGGIHIVKPNAVPKVCLPF